MTSIVYTLRSLFWVGRPKAVGRFGIFFVFWDLWCGFFLCFLVSVVFWDVCVWGFGGVLGFGVFVSPQDVWGYLGERSGGCFGMVVCWF